MSKVEGEEMARGDGEHDALLVALVLDPSTYSRNRFFDRHNNAVFRRVRRRASLVRSVVRHACVRGAGLPSWSSALHHPRDDGGRW